MFKNSEKLLITSEQRERKIWLQREKKVNGQFVGKCSGKRCTGPHYRGKMRLVKKSVKLVKLVD